MKFGERVRQARKAKRYDLRTLAGPGTCVVEATVTDPWGAVARDSFSFRVLAP